MRADATKAENLLWQALRNRRLEGLKFRRQVPVGGFIADFICFEARLIVEVDGGQHFESAHDAVRERMLAERGLKTLRFWNDEVEKNLDGVCLTILKEAKARGIPPESPPA
jgi:very-short-patch-repair endonuclease